MNIRITKCTCICIFQNVTVGPLCIFILSGEEENKRTKKIAQAMCIEILTKTIVTHKSTINSQELYLFLLIQKITHAKIVCPYLWVRTTKQTLSYFISILSMDKRTKRLECFDTLQVKKDTIKKCIYNKHRQTICLA